MTSVSDSASSEGLSGLLRRELRLDPLRMRSVARIAAGTAIAVAVAMVFQIPLPAYVAYLIFLLSQEDTASTLISAIGGLVAVTLAIALSLLFYVFDASEPALRIPLLALSTFLGMFLSRASALGPIAFLSGFVLVLSQTLVDDAPGTEALTHIVLWLWVVVATPVFTVIVINLLTGENPVSLSRQRAAALMDAVADYIELPFSQDPSLLREKLVALNQLKGKAFLWDKKLKAFAEEDQRLFGLMLEILQIARALPPQLAATSRHVLALSVRQSRALFLKRRGIDDAAVPAAQNGVEAETEPACEALRLALRDLHGEASGHTPAGTPHAGAAAPRRLLVPDAFHNPAHVRYALKVTFAVLAAYATYSLLDWPGISTAVTTCFFVSLGTFGESAHKLTLRISGALIGGARRRSVPGLRPTFADGYRSAVPACCRRFSALCLRLHEQRKHILRRHANGVCVLSWGLARIRASKRLDGSQRSRRRHRDRKHLDQRLFHQLMAGKRASAGTQPLVVIA